VQVLQNLACRHPEILHVDLSRWDPRGRVALSVSPTRGSVPLTYLAASRLCADDGYNGYDALAANPYYHGGLLAHARRKFMKCCKPPAPVAKGGWPPKKPWSSSPALRIEKEARAKELSYRNSTSCVSSRPPVLVNLSNGLSKRPADSSRRLLARRSAIPEPVVAADRLSQDGRLRPITTCENAIRPFVVGRKNWLFSVIHAGEASAFCTADETARPMALSLRLHALSLRSTAAGKTKTTTATC